MRAQSILLRGLTASVLGAFVVPSAADRDGPEIVTVAFGSGLNTPFGDPTNHHVVPPVIKVKVGDVVEFAVAGVHLIRIYDDGVRLRDIKAAMPDECELNPAPQPQCSFGGPGAPQPPVIPGSAPGGSFPQFALLPVFYQGIDPFNPPPPPAAQPVGAFAGTNRVETVLFSKPGRFLVICAVLPHFNNGMTAWVEVERDGNDRGKYGDDRRDHRYH